MEILIARMLGIWQTIHSEAGRGTSKKWAPFSIACAVIAGVCVSLWMILPFGREALWLGVPLGGSSMLIAWALFWPLNCATWFGWIAMLFRLIVVLAVSNVIWLIVVVAR